MLAPLAGEPGLAHAVVVVHLVDALTAVGAGVRRAVVRVHVAQLAAPAGVADALVAEELVGAEAVDALAGGAQVHLGLAALAAEAWKIFVLS